MRFGGVVLEWMRPMRSVNKSHEYERRHEAREASSATQASRKEPINRDGRQSELPAMDDEADSNLTRTRWVETELDVKIFQGTYLLD